MSDPALSTVAVDLGERGYDIVIGPSLLASSGERLRPHLSRPRLVVVTDANVARLHLKTLAASLDAARRPAHALEAELAEVTGIEPAELVDRLRFAWDAGASTDR